MSLVLYSDLPSKIQSRHNIQQELNAVNVFEILSPWRDFAAVVEVALNNISTSQSHWSEIDGSIVMYAE